MKRLQVVFIGLALLSGCATVPLTGAELARGSAYVPLSPKPIEISGDDLTSTEMLNVLPNETVRMSIGSTDSDGNITFGVGAVGVEGHTYEVVVDYIKYTTGYMPASFTSTAVDYKGKYIANRVVSKIKTFLGSVDVSSDLSVKGQEDIANRTNIDIQQRVAVFVGVGVRLRASVRVWKGKVNLASLYGIGAAANSGAATGSLVFETLGIYGAPISPLIPLPTEISQASVQSTLQSLAAIKAKLYDANVGVAPVIVAFESPYASSVGTQVLAGAIQSTDPSAVASKKKLVVAPLAKLDEGARIVKAMGAEQENKQESGTPKRMQVAPASDKIRVEEGAGGKAPATQSERSL